LTVLPTLAQGNERRDLDFSPECHIPPSSKARSAGPSLDALSLRAERHLVRPLTGGREDRVQTSGATGVSLAAEGCFQLPEPA
jgi:hypothetical protein